MKFIDIETFTYIGIIVIIDGVGRKVKTPLHTSLNAVQYHKGRGVLEEPLMKKVANSKYESILQEWVDAEVIPDNTPQPITVVTMRQARLALLQMSLLPTITEAINSSADEALKIEWEYATEIKRDWQSLIDLTASLGMTETQLDNLFVLASGL